MGQGASAADGHVASSESVVTAIEKGKEGDDGREGAKGEGDLSSFGEKTAAKDDLIVSDFAEEGLQSSGERSEEGAFAKAPPGRVFTANSRGGTALRDGLSLAGDEGARKGQKTRKRAVEGLLKEVTEARARVELQSFNSQDFVEGSDGYFQKKEHILALLDLARTLEKFEALKGVETSVSGVGKGKEGGEDSELLPIDEAERVLSEALELTETLLQHLRSGGQQPLAHKQETGRSPFGNRTEGPVARQGTVLTLEDPADTVEGGGTFSFGTVLIDGSRKGKTKKGIGAATAAATGALSARGAATVLSVSPREVSSGEERGEAAGEAEGEGEEQRSSSAQSSGEGSGGSAKERLTVEEKMGETRKLQLRVLAGLGKVYRLKLTFQRAYELHRRQLHLAETIYGKESEEVSDALYQLAFACDELNKTEELLHCDRQCFQLRLSLLGMQSKKTHSALKNLLADLRDAGKAEEASELERDNLWFLAS